MIWLPLRSLDVSRKRGGGRGCLLSGFQAKSTTSRRNLLRRTIEKTLGEKDICCGRERISTEKCTRSQLVLKTDRESDRPAKVQNWLAANLRAEGNELSRNGGRGVGKGIISIGVKETSLKKKQLLHRSSEKGHA